MQRLHTQSLITRYRLKELARFEIDGATVRKPVRVPDRFPVSDSTYQIGTPFEECLLRSVMGAFSVEVVNNQQRIAVEPPFNRT